MTPSEVQKAAKTLFGPHLNRQPGEGAQRARARRRDKAKAVAAAYAGVPQAPASRQVLRAQQLKARKRKLRQDRKAAQAEQLRKMRLARAREAAGLQVAA